MSFTKLAQRDGPGLGYDVVLRNDSNEDLFANAVEISGARALEIHGAGAVLERAVYDVVLDSSVAEGSRPTLDGTAYEALSPDFGAKCTGQFTYEISTRDTQKSWKYSFCMPIMCRIPPKDRVVLRILFRRNSRSLVERTTEGSSGGFQEPGIVKLDRHSLSVKLENGEALSYTVDDGFLRLIVQRDKLPENMQRLLLFAARAIECAEEYQAIANQRTGSERSKYLGFALSEYQRAQMVLTMPPPRLPGCPAIS